VAETQTAILQLDQPPKLSECVACVQRFQERILQIVGVHTLEIQGGLLKLKYNTEIIHRVGLERDVQRVAEEIERAYEHARFELQGMDCDNCAATISARLRRLPGVSMAEASFITSHLHIEFENGHANGNDVINAVRDLGFQAVAAGSEREFQPRPDGWRTFLLYDRQSRLSLVALTLLLVGWMLSFTLVPEWSWRAIIAVAIVVGGFQIANNGVRAVLLARRIDMHVLMTIAIIGAIAIDQWVEGALVVVLFSLGQSVEGFTVNRARGSIRDSLQTAPTYARIIHNDHQHLRLAIEVEVGDRIAIRSGERVSADGRIERGLSMLNEAAITGESLPVSKGPGDRVFAGSVNESDYLEIVADRPGSDSMIARITKMMLDAQVRRAPIQRMVDRFAAVYTPLIMVGAILMATIPPLVVQEPFQDWFLRALVLLVIACPCALVISTPVAVASALATAVRHGVVIKGGAFLEILGNLRTIAFDKTGTVTMGVPSVQNVTAFDNANSEEVIYLARVLEEHSEHALARAVRLEAEARGLSTDLAVANNVVAEPGRGIYGNVDGHHVALGSANFLAELGIDLVAATEELERLATLGATAIVVARKNSVLGVIGVTDQVRNEAAPTISSLRNLGINRCVMLTGDRATTSAVVAHDIDFAEVHAELLPDHKVNSIDDFKNDGGLVAMVGDGINDTPALAAADVGIAMGAGGTDSALEIADVVLLDDDLERLPECVILSRRTVRTIQVNIAFAIAIKIVLVGLTIVGLSTLWMAVLADVGASLIVTVNGLRLLRHSWPLQSTSSPR
jgi:Cd2+/Zn2+-exporting ATPase